LKGTTMHWYEILTIVLVVIIMIALTIWWWGKNSEVVELKGELHDILDTDGSPPRTPESEKPDRFSELKKVLKAPLKDLINQIFLAFYATIFVLSMFFRRDGEWSVAWPWLVALLAFCHFSASWREINERSQGVRKAFGHVFPQKLNSGLHFVPWPAQLTTFTKNTIKVDWGTARKEDQALIEQAEKSESWYIRGEPRRVTWADINTMKPAVPADVLDRFRNHPLAGTVVTDPRGYFNMNIYDPAQFIAEVGSVDEAIDCVIDTCLAVLQEEAGKTCLALAVGEIESFSERMKRRVEWLIGDPTAEPMNSKPVPKSWGVDVSGLHLKDFGTAYDTNKSLVGRTKAIADADGEATATARKSEGRKAQLTNEGIGAANAKKADAEAEEVRLAAEGRGRAKAREAEGLAEAAALKALGEAAATPGGRVVMQTRAWEAGLKEGKVVIVPQNMGDIASTLIAGKEILDNLGKNKDPDKS
jgi:regulator of protease activity HflC (stomatin/prohibitin superfamily)/nitrogen fixation-related uncharacterized protein